MIARDPDNSAQAEQGSEFATLLGARLGEILENASTIAEVRAELAQRAFMRKWVLLGLASVAGLVLGLVALLGAWQLAHGLAQVLGELYSGLLLMGILVLAALLVLARLDRKRGGAELERRERAAWEGLKGSATELVREHPYATLGAAFAAGFAAAPLAKKLVGEVGLSGLPGIGPILRQAHAPKSPTNSAH